MNLVKTAIKSGFGFGLTSGVITTLGLIIGLDSSTHSKLAVIGGILTIAVADAFSDALGMHVASEAEDGKSDGDVWRTTFSTFIFKFITAITFIIPAWLLPLEISVPICIAWSILILVITNYYLAKSRGKKVFEVIFEHLFVATLVIVISHFLGKIINHYF